MEPTRHIAHETTLGEFPRCQNVDSVHLIRMRHHCDQVQAAQHVGMVVLLQTTERSTMLKVSKRRAALGSWARVQSAHCGQMDSCDTIRGDLVRSRWHGGLTTARAGAARTETHRSAMVPGTDTRPSQGATRHVSSAQLPRAGGARQPAGHDARCTNASP